MLFQYSDTRSMTKRFPPWETLLKQTLSLISNWKHLHVTGSSILASLLNLETQRLQISTLRPLDSVFPSDSDFFSSIDKSKTSLGESKEIQLFPPHSQYTSSLPTISNSSTLDPLLESFPDLIPSIIYSQLKETNRLTLELKTKVLLAMTRIVHQEFDRLLREAQASFANSSIISHDENPLLPSWLEILDWMDCLFSSYRLETKVRLEYYERYQSGNIHSSSPVSSSPFTLNSHNSVPSQSSPPLPTSKTPCFLFLENWESLYFVDSKMESMILERLDLTQTFS